MHVACVQVGKRLALLQLACVVARLSMMCARAYDEGPWAACTPPEIPSHGPQRGPRSATKCMILIVWTRYTHNFPPAEDTC